MQKKTGNSNESTPVVVAERSSEGEQSCAESNDPPDQRHPAKYLDFEVEIRPGKRHQYPVAVLNSPGGETASIMSWPYTHASLDVELAKIDTILLRASARRRRRVDPSELAIQEFGASLFDALMVDEIRSVYDVSRQKASELGYGLRIKLRVAEPKLATLPWEYMYDRRHDQYLGLSTRTPIVRYLKTQLPPRALLGAKPLRILGMAASPKDTPTINSRSEKQRVEAALKELIQDGLIELKWIEGATWRDLQRELLQGPWHVFHFVGHGYFDEERDEGYVVLADEHGDSDRLSATNLAQLLADHEPLRLVLLNACDGAKAGVRDILSSSASILVKQGIPAVLAMQNAISNSAAVECARSFYQSIAYGHPVDAAAADARKGISLDDRNSPEWGVPVLYMRAPDGMLIDPSLAEHKRPELNHKQPVQNLQVPHQTDRDMVELVPTADPAATAEADNNPQSHDSGKVTRAIVEHVQTRQFRWPSLAKWRAALQPRFILFLLLGLVASLGIQHILALYTASTNDNQLIKMLSVAAGWGVMGAMHFIGMGSNLSDSGRKLLKVPLLWAVIWILAAAHGWLMATRGGSSPHDWYSGIVATFYGILGLGIAGLSQTHHYAAIAHLLVRYPSLHTKLPPALAIAGSFFVLTQLPPFPIALLDLQTSSIAPDPVHTLGVPSIMGWASHWATSITMVQVTLNISWLLTGQFASLLVAAATIAYVIVGSAGAANLATNVTPYLDHALLSSLALLPLFVWSVFWEEKVLYHQVRTAKNSSIVQRALILLYKRASVSSEGGSLTGHPSVWGGFDKPKNLVGADFAGWDLAGVSLQNLDLTGSSLCGANLKDVHLEGASLAGADLDKANLSQARLIGADICGATLIDTKLVDADLTHSLYDGHTEWPAGFAYRTSGAIGPGAIMKHAELSSIDLSEMDLASINFMGANLANARLNGADVTRANFRGANLSGADLRDAQHKNATFREATYTSETKWPQGLNPAKRGAILVSGKPHQLPWLAKPRTVPEVGENS